MDLTTRYLGLTLKSPLVAGASPLTGEVNNIRRLEDLGAGAVVLPSIFEEQIEQDERWMEHLRTKGVDSYAEALTYFPTSASAPASQHGGPEHHLEVLHSAARAVDIPVIASLNGTTDHGWIHYARQLQAAGAAALELNVYFIPADLALAGGEVERRYLDILTAVKRVITIPVAIKIGPYFSAMAHMATQLADAGANGLVLFNRFYEPDIDLAKLALSPTLTLSTAAEIRLPLLWIGVLSGRLRASLAASTGVEGADEVIKYLLAGADVVMTSSALLRHGIDHMGTLLDGLKSWLAARGLDTLDGVRGVLSQRNVADPTAFERANYVRILQSYSSQR